MGTGVKLACSAVGPLLLLLLVSSTTACRQSGPEQAVRGYMAAVNAGDCQKALEYVSPDRRWGFWSYDLGQPRSCRSRKVAKYYNIRAASVDESDRFPGCKEVRVAADRIKWDGAYQVPEALFVTESIEGIWYIRSASW